MTVGVAALDVVLRVAIRANHALFAASVVRQAVNEPIRHGVL